MKAMFKKFVYVKVALDTLADVAIVTYIGWKAYTHEWPTDVFNSIVSLF